jgi:REP element-mobilizing transposase RayT
MNDDDPIAYFITWTVYGTHLQGDLRGWRRRRKGNQLPQPLLEEWRRERLKHEVIRLTEEQRAIVEEQCQRHCDHRGWRLWEVNARSNHVHAVVTADGVSGKTVRDQLKANGTRALRERWAVFCDRPVWTFGGDWVCINSDDELEEVCAYVREAQDRMEFKEPKAGTGR